MGRFEYHGTRDDDPNDIYPHEHRRELRGSRVFAAWLNHDDSRAVNTMVVRQREGGRAYLKDHMVDFGSLLGSGTRFPNAVQSGHEYTIQARPALLTLLSLGFVCAALAAAARSARGLRRWDASLPTDSIPGAWVADTRRPRTTTCGPTTPSGRRGSSRDSRTRRFAPSWAKAATRIRPPPRCLDRRAHQAARSHQGGVAHRHQPDCECHPVARRGAPLRERGDRYTCRRTSRRLCPAMVAVRQRHGRPYLCRRRSRRSRTRARRRRPAVLQGSDHISVRIATRHPRYPPGCRCRSTSAVRQPGGRRSGSIAAWTEGE